MPTAPSSWATVGSWTRCRRRRRNASLTVSSPSRSERVLRATVKSLLARKLRLVLTALAIVLGVGFTAGTFVLTDTALKSFDDLFGQVYANTDVVVQAHQAFNPTEGGGGGGGGGQELNPIPERLLPSVRAVPGVRFAEGSVQSFAQIIDPTTGKVIQSGGAPTIGSSWSPDLSPFTLEPGGAAPVGPHEVVVDEGTATGHRLSVGEQIRVVTTSGPGEYTITGFVRFGSSNSLLGASFVGAFIIFNTFNIVVTQRSCELALFRALGATRRQVMTSVLVEAAVVGLVASVIGVLVGIVLAIGLKAVVGALGLKLPPTALVIAPRTVIVSLLLGTTITVAAAVSQARRG